MKSIYAQDKPFADHEKECPTPFQGNSSSFAGGLYKSETRVFLKKMQSNQTQVFPKQYTNKYFRTKSLYEEKENERILQFNRLSTFTRKAKAAANFRLKKFANCLTEPNQSYEQNELNFTSEPRALLELKPRNCNKPTSENPYSIQPFEARNQIIHELLSRNRKPKKLRQLHVNYGPFENVCPNFTKEKISTSRALQKYARIVKEDIFDANKSQLLQKSPLRKDISHHYSSNIETKQLVLCHKENRQPRCYAKKALLRLKPQALQSYCEEQNYDLKGWET